ncbi:YheC/YheD family protein [Laceyella putida]|uniref:YheC/YheD family protein n=1 Tax=Laceyella putida TaxID=110101 RepID=A0ABW2RNY8_9BACL
MAIGKMIKHREMLKHPVLRRYLPETHWLTPVSHLQMLRSYSSIFVKPNHGCGGAGIIRVERKRNGYEVRFGQKRKYVSSDSVYSAIRSHQKPSQQYLVQRGLRLAKYRGSIFDIRVYMQKPYSKWVISGMLARVAAPNRYVTNYHKGGHGESLNKVLSHLFRNNRRKVNHTLNEMANLSSIIAETLNKRHSGIRELGIDFGIEKSGRLWIIEANTRPGHKLFNQLPDKKMLFIIKKNKRLIQTLH